MTSVPEYRQLSGLISYLYQALRQDTVLLGFFGDAQQIVSKTLEHDPFLGDPEEPDLFVQELPLLAIWEVAAETIRQRRADIGERVTLALLYVFETQQGGGADLAPEDTAQRLSKLLWWRLKYWVRKRRFDPGDGQIDLFADNGIERIELGRVRRFGNPKFEGFMADLVMTHYEPPYTIADPDALQAIDLILETDDANTGGTTPTYYETEADVTGLDT